jgi:small subunit ribosomal protein S16
MAITKPLQFFANSLVIIHIFSYLRVPKFYCLTQVISIMAVKIRLQRHGSKKRPFYFIVVANTTAPRDGKFIEKLGTYNPLTVPATVRINRERSLYWLQKGAQPTNTCRRIMSFKGVLYLKHLMRGISLGLFDEKTAMEKFENWNGEHEQLVAKREETHRKAKAEKRSATIEESVRKVEEKNAAAASAATAESTEAPAEEA